MRTNDLHCNARGDIPNRDSELAFWVRRPGLRSLGHRHLIFISLALFCLLFVSGAFAEITNATMSAAPTQIDEGGESTVTITLTSQPISSPGQTASVLWEVSQASTATLGVDYEIVGGDVLSFDDPNYSQAITIRALNDNVFSEGPETVILTITECSWVWPIQESSGICPTGSSVTVTIFDTTPMPTATIEATDPNASKDGPDPGQFTVSLSAAAPPSGLTVGYSVGGSAVPNQDYRGLDGFVFIAQGQASANIPVTPLSGTSSGGDTVIVTLLAGSSYVVGQPSSATVTIADQVVALSTVSGDGQVASTGVQLQPFVVGVSTSNGSPAAGVPIVWTLVSGGGALSSARTVTDAQGQASSTLTPGSNGEFVVSAQVEGTSQTVTFSALFNPLASLPGLTGPQRSMARTLDILCPKLAGTADQRALTVGEQDLLTQCQALITSSVSNPGAATQGVAALTPEQASAPRKLATQITGAQLDNITTRLSALRRGARGISLRDLTVSMDRQGVTGSTVAGMAKQLDQNGGGASADDTYEFERLGIFVNGNIDWGSKDRSANEDGFDFNTQGITAGVDYRFLDGLVLGLAFGYGNTDANIDANGGDIGANALSSTVYGTYYATDHFYLEGSGTYGWGSYDQTRNISYLLLGGTREAKADYDGSQYALMFGAGYDFVRGPGILDLYGRLRYVNVDLDSYREKGASGLDLTIDSQSATSLMSIFGVNYTSSISLAKVVLVPQGWFEWLHEYDNGDDRVTGVFVNDPNRIPFSLATDSFDTDSFRVGMGVGAMFGQGRTAFLTYEARVGLNNYTEQSANIGVRLDF